MDSTTGRLRGIGFGALLLFLSFASAQEPSVEKAKTSTPKTAIGVEVTLLETKLTEDYYDNRVPQFRMGSCPPGAVLPGIKIEANSGTDVILVLLGLRFPPDYQGTDFPIPVLLDVDGKKHASRSMMQPSRELVPRIKATGEQLRCEIPFEVPAGTQITKLQYDNIVFDVKIKNASQ